MSQNSGRLECFIHVSSIIIVYYKTCSVPIYCQENMYLPFFLEKRYMDVHPEHLCSTKRSIPICCIDERGNLLILTVLLNFTISVFEGV